MKEFDDAQQQIKDVVEYYKYLFDKKQSIDSGSTAWNKFICQQEVKVLEFWEKIAKE